MDMRIQEPKRSNWKQNLLTTLKKAAQDLGDIPRREIDRTIGDYRRARKEKPEITVSQERQKSRA
jgi:hypothetical protein